MTILPIGRTAGVLTVTHHDKKDKMKIQLPIIISIILTIGCESQNKPVEKRDYEIIFDEGIYVEKFDSTNVSENRYTANNLK